MKYTKGTVNEGCITLISMYYIFHSFLSFFFYFCILSLILTIYYLAIDMEYVQQIKLECLKSKQFIDIII